MSVNWDRFVERAAYVRNNPRFDVEERERNRAVARSVREAIGGVPPGGEALGATLEGVFDLVCDDARPYRLMTPLHNEWLRGWARADQVSARDALIGCLDPKVGALSRFARFVEAAESATRAGTAALRPRVALQWGALLNFAVSPGLMPAIRLRPFEQLERELEWNRPRDESVLGQYEHHVDFARHLARELRQAGVAISDMLDVQGLIFLFAEPLAVPAEPSAPTLRPPSRERPLGPAGAQGTKKAYLAICSSLAYEAAHLVEWIEFHRLVGVERFFLYDNERGDEQRQVLEPYVEDGVVVLHPWSVSPGQIPAFQHCIEHHRADSQWIAFLDADEFLFSPAGEAIPPVLRDYEDFPGVGVNWAIFGTSGHRTRPQGLDIENYVLRTHSHSDRCIKSVVQPDRTVRCVSAHHFVYSSGSAVDENRYPIGDISTTYVSSSRLRINHYYTRSEEQLRAKLGRQRADLGILRDPVDFDSLLRPERGREDHEITRYVPALREAVRAAERSRARPTG